MENVLPRYQRPLPSKSEPVNIVAHWNNAVEAFDDKEYKKSVVEIIRYMNPDILKDVDITQDIAFSQQQGSAEIQVRITDSLFSVKVPFLKITEKTNRMALLRRVAEINFSPLKLVQIRLNNDKLCFEYSMPLELCQPNKTFDVLHNIAVYSDEYDDIFIQKYKADFYKKPVIEALTAEEKKLVWHQISNIFEDYQNYSTFFKEKRWDGYIWDIIVISLLKLSNMPYMQGKLRSDLIEYISNLFNGDIDFKYRVDKGVNFMKKLLAMSQEEIMSNIYHAEWFVSLRWRSSEQIISDRLSNYVDKVKKAEKDKSYFDIAYYLQFVFLKLIYDFNLDPVYKEKIEDVLERVSGFAPEEAAPKLIKVFYELQSGNLHDKETKKEKKGFFSKLFD